MRRSAATARRMLYRAGQSWALLSVPALVACSAAVGPDLALLADEGDALGLSDGAPGLQGDVFTGPTEDTGATPSEPGAGDATDAAGANGLDPSDGPGPQLDPVPPTGEPTDPADPVAPVVPADPADLGEPPPEGSLLDSCLQQSDCRMDMGLFCETQPDSFAGLCSQPCQTSVECLSPYYEGSTCVQGRCALSCQPGNLFQADQPCPADLECVDAGGGGFFGGAGPGGTFICMPAI